MTISHIDGKNEVIPTPDKLKSCLNCGRPYDEKQEGIYVFAQGYFLWWHKRPCGKKVR